MERDRQALIKDLQNRFEKINRESEISILEHWKGMLDRLACAKPEGVAALQMQIKKIADMMANRIGYLKKQT